MRPVDRPDLTESPQSYKRFYGLIIGSELTLRCPGPSDRRLKTHRPDILTRSGPVDRIEVNLDGVTVNGHTHRDAINYSIGGIVNWCAGGTETTVKHGHRIHGIDALPAVGGIIINLNRGGAARTRVGQHNRVIQRITRRRGTGSITGHGAECLRQIHTFDQRQHRRRHRRLHLHGIGHSAIFIGYAFNLGDVEFPIAFSPRNGDASHEPVRGPFGENAGGGRIRSMIRYAVGICIIEEQHRSNAERARRNIRKRVCVVTVTCVGQFQLIVDGITGICVGKQ